MGEKPKDRYEEWGKNFWKGMGCFFTGLLILLVVIVLIVYAIVF